MGDGGDGLGQAGLAGQIDDARIGRGDAGRRFGIGRAISGDGLDEVWEAVLKHRAELESDGDLSARRHAQQRDWLWNMVRDELSEALRTSPEVQAVAAEVEAKLDTETLSALEGAQVILGAFADAITTFPWGRRSAD